VFSDKFFIKTSLSEQVTLLSSLITPFGPKFILSPLPSISTLFVRVHVPSISRFSVSTILSESINIPPSFMVKLPGLFPRVLKKWLPLSTVRLPSETSTSPA